MFTIAHHFARRGQEGIDMLTKDHFKIFEDEGRKFFKKILGEVSKNHSMDDQDMQIGGIIPILENNSFSPGQFLKDYLTKLNPGCTFIFQKPKRIAANFKLESNPSIW